MINTQKKPAQANPRKRILLACNGCRAKRTKCDGRKPQCSACQYRQQGCEYTQEESNRKRPSNAYIAALEARVATLEKMLDKQQPKAAIDLAHEPSDGLVDCDAHHQVGDVASFPMVSTGGQDCDDASNEAASPRSRSSGETRKDSAVNEHRSENADENADENAVHSDVDELADALGCFTLGDTGELRFFGAASNFTVVQDYSLKVPSSVEAKARGIAAARAAAAAAGFSEPSDELRDHLLGLFWTYQNAWQYLVPREPFVRDLCIEHTGRYCTPLLLTAMLALASRYSSRPELRTDPDDANTAGEALAHQAQTMLHYEYEAPTTSTAQATALLGLFWAAVDNEGLGFMYIGMASRMAMNLGLHSDCSAYAAKELVSEEDVEVRNITFWGIYVLDKLYCLGMGRPASINEYNITTTRPKVKPWPGAQLPEHLAAMSSPYPTAHITSNVGYACELMLVTSEVIDQLYAQRFAWNENEREDRVMKAHLNATKLFNRLPKDLKMSNSNLQLTPPYVYQLHLQYHQSILLLHRPFFRLLYAGKHSIAYDPMGGDVHSRSVRDSALKISRILQIYKNNYTHRYIPISAVHPVFTASIMHLLHIKSENEAGSASGARRCSEAVRGLTICIRSLYEMNTNWEWANRSIRAVRTLAAQWGIDIWGSGLRDEIADENWRQFERYDRGCLSMTQWQTTAATQVAPNPYAGIADVNGSGNATANAQVDSLGSAVDDSQAGWAYAGDTMGDLFEAWTYDQGLLQLPFALFDEQ